MNPCDEWVLLPFVLVLVWALPVIALALAFFAWRKRPFCGGLAAASLFFVGLDICEIGRSAVANPYLRVYLLFLFAAAVAMMIVTWRERESLRSGFELLRVSKFWLLLVLGAIVWCLPYALPSRIGIKTFLNLLPAIIRWHLPISFYIHRSVPLAPIVRFVSHLVFALWTVVFGIELFTRKSWPMFQQFSAARLKKFCGTVFGVRLERLSRLPGNSHSLNYAARDCGGARFVLKCIKGVNDSTLRRILAHVKMICYPNAPTMLFDGKVAAFGEYSVFALKWVDGERKSLDRLSHGEIMSLVRSYSEFQAALTDDGEILPERDLVSARSRLTARLNVKAAPEIARELAEMSQTDLVRDPALVKVIHGDLNFGNLHFRNGELSGFIDIEELRFGYPAEDLVRYAISSAEHLKWYEFSRFRKLRRAFAELARNAGYSAHEWNLAINGYLLRKLQKKIRKSRPSLLVRLNFSWRLRLYRELREIVRNP